VLIALLVITSSASGWSRQRLTKDAPDGYEDVGLAANDRGDAAIVFEGRAGISVAIARRGRAFGRPRIVRGGGDFTATQPRVAVDERGNVLVLWSYNDGTEPDPPFARDEGCCRRIHLSLRRAGGRSFGRPRTVGPPGQDSELQAFSMVNGRIGVGWTDYDGVAARFSRRGLAFGRAVRANGDSALAAVPLRTGPTLTFLRERFDSDEPTTWTIHEVRVRRGRAQKPRQVHSRRGGYPTVALAANASGDQALAWGEESGAFSSIFAGSRKRNGRFRVRRMTRRGTFSDPEVAIAPSGAAVVGWNRAGRAIYTAPRRPGRGFGPARQFGAALRRPGLGGVRVAVDAAGRALIVWNQRKRRTSHLMGAFRTGGGRRFGFHDFGWGNTDSAQSPVTLGARRLARVGWRFGASVHAARGHIPRR